MGYDLYITRARRWAQSATQPIRPQEWLDLVAKDSSLQLKPVNGPYFVEWTAASPNPEWLDWFQGHIHSKFPSPALIDKMVEIAGKLGARVVGEEDERYSSGSRPPVPYQPSFGEQAGAVWRRLFPPPPLPLATSPFAPGDRVRDVWGHCGVVVAVDPAAAHGLGTITVRYDSGQERSWSMRANPLSPE